MTQATALYVAGPMSGYDNYNFEAFEEVELWYAENYPEIVILSPATYELTHGHAEWQDNELVVKETFDYSEALARDFDLILGCDGIVFLPGWENSTGAKSEFFVGYRTGLKFYSYRPDSAISVWRWTDRLADTYFQDLFEQAGDTPSEWVDSSPVREVQPDSNNQLGEIKKFDEIRVKNETTGGEKGSKLARFDLLPYDAIWELAKHYGRGSLKYEERNWERGYNWGLSFAAAQRHLAQFWAGEDIDPETGTPHVIAAAWHSLALYRFMQEFPEFDSRGRTQKPLQ